MAALLGAVAVPHAVYAAPVTTEVQVYSTDDISKHSTTEKVKFVLQNDVVAESVRITGKHQLWEGINHTLTLGGNSGENAGGMYLNIHGNTLIADNGHIEFRNNVVNDSTTGITYLHGLYVKGNSSCELAISASENQDILFYDAATFDYCPGMRLNSKKASSQGTPPSRLFPTRLPVCCRSLP